MTIGHRNNRGHHKTKFCVICHVKRRTTTPQLVRWQDEKIGNDLLPPAGCGGCSDGGGMFLSTCTRYKSTFRPFWGHYLSFLDLRNEVFMKFRIGVSDYPSKAPRWGTGVPDPSWILCQSKRSVLFSASWSTCTTNVRARILLLVLTWEAVQSRYRIYLPFCAKDKEIPCGTAIARLVVNFICVRVW